MRGGTQTRLNCMNSVIEENRRNLSLHKMASLSSLHYRLGKAIEDAPGKVARIDKSGRYLDSNKHHFEGLQTDALVARPHFEADEETRAEAERQWSEIPDSPDAIRKWMKGGEV